MEVTTNRDNKAENELFVSQFFIKPSFTKALRRIKKRRNFRCIMLN